jgi:hypothetical protein
MNKNSFTRVVFVSILCAFAHVAIAGSEDWEGTLTLIDSKGKENLVVHTPAKVNIGWVTVGNTYPFSKGSKINDIVASEDGSLSVKMNVEKFIQELGKLGSVTDKKIMLGPTYHNAN